MRTPRSILSESLPARLVSPLVPGKDESPPEHLKKSTEQAGHREMLFVRHGRVDVREWFGFLELSLQTPGSKIMEASDQQCWNVCFIS